MDILALIISALSLVSAGVGTYLARQVMETGKPGDSVEQRVKKLDLLMSCGLMPSVATFAIFDQQAMTWLHSPSSKRTLRRE